MLAEIERFVNWVRRRSPAAHTWRDYRCDLQVFLEVVGDCKPGEVTFHETDRFIALQSEQGFKPATINRRLACVVALYAFLGVEDEGLICPVHRKRHHLREQQRLPRPVQEDDLKQFFAVIENARDRAMFILMLRCGLRIGEVSNLQMGDLYLGEDFPRLVVHGKGSRDRAVYLSPPAQAVECRHEALAVGERCPACGRGTLYRLPPGVEMRLDGNALLSAVRYELEKLRCSACGQVFTATLPAGASEAKYSPRARAVLAVSRYYLGLPFYRIESYQAMLGVPVPDATQWEQIERVADCGYVVFAHLESLAAQGELIYQDDTPARILSLIEENQQAQAHAAALGMARTPERTGMYTTALVVKVGEHTICLYYSGRSHAGANLKAL